MAVTISRRAWTQIGRRKMSVRTCYGIQISRGNPGVMFEETVPGMSGESVRIPVQYYTYVSTCSGYDMRHPS